MFLFELHETFHVGINHCHLSGQFSPIGTIGLFHAQTVHSIDTEVGNTKRLSGGPNRIIERLELIHGHMQLPTQFTNIVDPECSQFDSRHFNGLGSKPSEMFIAQISMSDFRQQFPGSWSGQHQNAPVVGDICDCDVLGLENAVVQ